MTLYKKFVLASAFTLMTFSLQARSESLEPNSWARVSEDRASVGVIVDNPFSVDLFCNTIELDVVLAGRDYNDFSAHAKFHSPQVYLNKKTQVDMSEMGSAETLSSRGVLGIATAVVDTKSCRVATFADYCDYGAKSSDEAYVVNQILRTVRRDCSTVEEKMGNSLDLSNQNIRTLKPIGFLKSLETLNVEKNHVEDLNPIRSLGKLKVLVVNQNPIRDLSPALRLLSIEKIKANGTLVETLVDPGSPRRKKITVELENTPYKIKNKK